MKRYLGIVAAILVACGLSEVIQGLLLTWLYKPNLYEAGQLTILPSIIRHGLTALIAIVLIYGADKFQKKQTKNYSCSENAL